MGGLLPECDGWKCAKIACGNTWSPRRTQNFNRRPFSGYTSNWQECVMGTGSLFHAPPAPCASALAQNQQQHAGYVLARREEVTPRSRNQNNPPTNFRPLRMLLLGSLSSSNSNYGAPS